MDLANSGCDLTLFQVRIAAYVLRRDEGSGLPVASLTDEVIFLFTKLQNRLCLLLCQHYFSDDRFLVSPTIT